MTWSEDQQSTHALSSPPTGVDKPAEHPAKSIMARRWEQRRAEANARWSDQTSSAVLERSELSRNLVTTEVPATQNVLDDLQELERKTATPLKNTRGFLGDTRRAMLIVVLVGNGVLLALLYGGGFLG